MSSKRITTHAMVCDRCDMRVYGPDAPDDWLYISVRPRPFLLPGTAADGLPNMSSAKFQDLCGRCSIKFKKWMEK